MSRFKSAATAQLELWEEEQPILGIRENSMNETLGVKPFAGGGKRRQKKATTKTPGETKVLA